MLKYEGVRGRVQIVDHTSELLANNALGDPPVRRVAVWTPPEYEGNGETRYPTIYYLASFTSSGLKALNWDGFSENIVERLDRLVGTGKMAPTIVVMPDGFTSLGGNQYIDSPAVGPWASYLTKELVPFVDENWRTLDACEHRGVFGYSSGGYGALVHGMLHPDVWGGIACHSGDMYFPYACLPDFPLAIDTLRRFEGNPAAFLKKMRTKIKLRGSDIMTLMILALAAFYDPDLENPDCIQLPFDARTGELIDERWQQWLRWDPVQMAEEHVDNLKKLKCLFFDCGSRDQYRLHHGARILAQRFEDLGVPYRYEEFDDDHSSIQYRYDVSLPLLADTLS